MPIKKSKKNKVKSRHIMHSIHNSSNLQRHRHQTLIDLITKLSEATNEKQMSKSRNNLPAKLMQLPNRTKSMRIMPNMQSIQSFPIMNAINKISFRAPTYKKNLFSNSSSNAISSTFSSYTHNGHTHSKGKKIINKSSSPYIKIDEMKNGNIHRYIVPKDTIPYKQPTGIPIDMNLRNHMDMNMYMDQPESNIIVYSTIGKKNMKHIKSKTTKKNKKHKTTKPTKTTKTTKKTKKTKTTKKNKKTKNKKNNNKKTQK